jgi:hypothetical protein
MPATEHSLQLDAATKKEDPRLHHREDVRKPLGSRLRLSMRPNTHDIAESDISGMLYLQGARKPPSHHLRLSVPSSTHNAAERDCPGTLYLHGARDPLGRYLRLSM